jgi:WD40 repeat protein
VADTLTGESLRTYVHPDRGFWTAFEDWTISNDDSQLLIRDRDELTIYDLRTGHLRAIPPPRPTPDELALGFTKLSRNSTGVDFLEEIGCGMAECEARIYRLPNHGTRLLSLTKNTELRSLSNGTSDFFHCSTSSDCAISDIETGDLDLVSKTSEGSAFRGLDVRDFIFSGKTLLGAGQAGLNARDDVERLAVPMPGGYTKLISSESGRYVAAISPLQFVSVIDLQNLSEKWRLNMGSEVTAVAFASDDRYIAVGSATQLKVWSLPEPRALSTFAHDNRILTMAFDKSDSILALADAESGIILWDLLRDSTQSFNDEVVSNYIRDIRTDPELQFSSDGNFLLLNERRSEGGPASLLLKVRPVTKLLGREGVMSFSPDEHSIIVQNTRSSSSVLERLPIRVSSDQSAAIWRATLNQKDPDVSMAALGVSDYGASIIVNQDDPYFYRLRPSDGRVLSRTRMDAALADAIHAHFSPDGSIFIATEQSCNYVPMEHFVPEDDAQPGDGPVVLREVPGQPSGCTTTMWDTKTGQRRLNLQEKEYVVSIALSSDIVSLG